MRVERLGQRAGQGFGLLGREAGLLEPVGVFQGVECDWIQGDLLIDQDGAATRLRLSRHCERIDFTLADDARLRRLHNRLP